MQPVWCLHWLLLRPLIRWLIAQLLSFVELRKAIRLGYLELGVWLYHNVNSHPYISKHEHEALDTWNSRMNTDQG